MKSVGADYLGSDAKINSRFMCFEYDDKVLEVDMKETNRLLVRLLESSDKQVNRLGDIGTT